MFEKLKTFIAYSASVSIVALAAALLQHLSMAPALGLAYYWLALISVCVMDRCRTANVQEIAWKPVWRQRGLYIENGMLQVAPIGDYVQEECPVAVNGYTFEDRMLGYFFVAPLILPARLYNFVRESR